MAIPVLPGKQLKTWLRRYSALRYLLAVLLGCVGGVLQFAVQWLTGMSEDAGAYEFFLGATALSAVWGGRVTGLVTLLLSALFKLYFFLPPFGSFRIESPASAVRFVLFLAIGCLICTVGGAVFASQQILASTLNSIGDAVVATDDRKVIQFMNPVTEVLSGWNAEEAVGRNINDVLHFVDEKTREPAQLPIDATLRRGTTAHLTANRVLISKSGRDVPVEDTISPILGGSQQPRGAIMAFHDVTEQRRAEKALRESDSSYRFLADSVPAIIFTTDPAAECNYCNQRWYDYSGLTPAQTMGRGWTAALHPEEAAQVEARWRECVQTGTPFELEYRLRSREGNYRWFLVRGFPMRDEHGETVRWFGSCTDVDDFKRTQEQLHQALKMEAVGRLAGGVAHDFNNLLTVIIGYAQLLSDSAPPGGTTSKQVKQIMYAAERASELTRQLLTFSRRNVIQPRLVELNSVLLETETMVRRLIGENIAIHTVLHPNLLPVRIDQGQLEQVIVNLAVNARDAMPEGGSLTFQTANVNVDESYLQVDPGPYVLLLVSDNGHGMDQETQAHIFEPFFTTKGPEKGTGLGLSTVYGIVKQSGGFIQTDSEPGQGTTFKIYLPAAVEGGAEVGDTAQPAAQPVPAQAGGTETILVVEDEAAVRHLVIAILRQQGYTLLEADSPQEALRQCKEYAGTIDLLLTDVVMPGMSGVQMSEQALECRPEMKVLYMSGHTDHVIALPEGQDSGVAFIQKPFSFESLSRKVREVLDS